MLSPSNESAWIKVAGPVQPEDGPNGSSAGSVEVPIPPLTSIFTPAALCSSLFINSCDNTGCTASVGADIHNFLFDASTLFSCFPSNYQARTAGVGVSSNLNMKDKDHDGDDDISTAAGSYIAPVLTYSPGLFCPQGMTTATSLELWSGVYCCYSGFVYGSDAVGGSTGHCVANLTQGTFRAGTSIIEFGPSQTDLFKSVANSYGNVTWTSIPILEATAPAIFLAGKQPLTGPSLTSESPAKPSNTSQVENNISKDNDRGSTLGLTVGLSVGLSFLICLGFIFLRRYRKKRLARLKDGGTPAKDVERNEYNDKPELEGSMANSGPFIKAELDALAIRAELEGSPGEEYNTAGIGVVKPELHGSPGVPGLLGVYVKKKAELEAPSNFNIVSQFNSSPLTWAQDSSATDINNESAELECWI
ncbi:hypothetical protein F4777DRAFT_535441 [Nemania sp. FL0916]|nr:hypothetical protein F4777DRAFT_535441 [Nemania sp. FL0916]